MILENLGKERTLIINQFFQYQEKQDEICIENKVKGKPLMSWQKDYMWEIGFSKRIQEEHLVAKNIIIFLFKDVGV